MTETIRQTSESESRRNWMDSQLEVAMVTFVGLQATISPSGPATRVERRESDSTKAPGLGSEKTVKNEYAAGEFSHLNDRRTVKNSRYSDQYVPQSKGREERARSFHSESSSNASHVTSQNGGVMLGRYQVEAPEPYRAFGGRNFAEEGTLHGEAL